MSDTGEEIFEIFVDDTSDRPPKKFVAHGVQELDKAIRDAADEVKILTENDFRQTGNVILSKPNDALLRSIEISYDCGGQHEQTSLDPKIFGRITDDTLMGDTADRLERHGMGKALLPFNVFMLESWVDTGMYRSEKQTLEAEIIALRKQESQVRHQYRRVYQFAMELARTEMRNVITPKKFDTARTAFFNMTTFSELQTLESQFPGFKGYYKCMSQWDSVDYTAAKYPYVYFLGRHVEVLKRYRETLNPTEGVELIPAVKIVIAPGPTPNTITPISMLDIIDDQFNKIVSDAPQFDAKT